MVRLSLKLLTGILYLGFLSAALGSSEQLVVGQTFLASSLDPRQGSTPWALTSHGIAEKLFTVDENGEIVGQVGKSVSKVSETVWEVTIKANYKFSDGTAVDAQHVADSLEEQNQQNSGAQSSLGSLTATAVGDLTVRIESEKITHIMDSVLAEWAFVIYYQDSNENFIFTGPYAVQDFSEDKIDLVPNEFYPLAEERPLIKMCKFPDGDALAKGVKNQEVDIGFHLPIDALPELRNIDGIRIRSFEVGYHYMVFYNTETLPDVLVRKAFDAAIDRTVLSQALAGGTATRSLFPDNSPFFSDESDPHGDLEVSAALLDEAGWTLNSQGQRTNQDGQVLQVRLVAYPHRPGLVIMQPIIAAALEDLGVQVETILTSDDWSDTQTILDERTFEMILWAQHTLPAGDPAWFLTTFFHTDGGNNHAGFSSSKVDGLLDNLSVAEDHPERIFLAQTAQDGILQEAPVSNLVTPVWHVSLSDKVADYEPYGSDYYVVRADLRATPIEEDSSTGSAWNPVMATTTFAWGVGSLLWMLA